jgi:large subunit ribosomal protein L54
MICQRCLLRLSRQITHRQSSRQLSSSSRHFAETVSTQATTATNPRPHGVPAATSTSAAQPFSTPELPSPSRHVDLPIQPEQSKKPTVIQSSVPAGTVLKGLNFIKQQQDPVALEDHEYPAWLWGVLAENKEKSAKDEKEGDLFGE